MRYRGVTSSTWPLVLGAVAVIALVIIAWYLFQGPG